MDIDPSFKAPVPPDAIPQERFTGDVMRGYGPRRGNLERLLRYWRPIMRREGGFRRCRVILADHPELYPLNNICAWLHHETTGLWPNEGCHHPGMKNCRRKIRGVVDGSIWNDREWNARLSRLPKGDGKGLDMGMEDDDMTQMSPSQIEEKAAMMLKEFLSAMPDFVNFIENDDNWEHEGDDDNSMPVIHIMKPGIGGMHDDDDDDDCGCGCGGAGSCKPKPTPMPLMAIMQAISQLRKSVDTEMSTKAGRVISNRNMQKLQQAMELLQEVVVASKPSDEPVVQVKASGEVRISAAPDQLFEVKSLIDPILDFHQIDAEVNETGIYFGSNVSGEAKSAMINALAAYKDLHKQVNH